MKVQAGQRFVGNGAMLSAYTSTLLILLCKNHNHSDKHHLTSPIHNIVKPPDYNQESNVRYTGE